MMHGMKLMAGWRMGSALRGVLLSGAVLGAVGVLGGCPPRPVPPVPIQQVVQDPGAAPVIGSVPPSGGIYVGVGEEFPLRGEALAKGLTSRESIEREVLGGAATGTAPAVEELADVPPQAVKHYVRGRAKFNDRSYAEAIEEFEKALKIDPNAFPVLRLMGEACFHSRQLARGSAYLQKAAGLRPQDVTVNYLLARYMEEARQEAGALKHLLMADTSPERKTNVPLGPLVSLHLARALQVAGYHAAAAAEYREFLALIQQPIGSLRYDRELYYAMEERWAAELGAAENLAAVGEFGEAMAHYARALEGVPGDKYIGSRVVEASARLGKHEEAIAAALALADAGQARTESLALLTWAYRAAGRGGEMLTDLQARIAADGKDAGALLSLAHLQEKAGEKDRAIQSLDRYLRARPGEQAVLRHLVDLARAQGRTGVAFNAIARSLAASPEKLGEHRDVLARLVGEKPTRDVVGALAREPITVISSDPPGYAAARDVLLAVASVRADDLAGAQGWYEAALEKQPAFWAARESLVALLLAQEKFAQADAVIERGLALNSGGIKARELQIEAQIAQERYAVALKLALKARDDFPASPEIRLLLATVYRLRGQEKEAAGELGSLVERFPKFEAGYRAALDMAMRSGDRQRSEELLGKLVTELPTSRYAQLRTAVYLFQQRRPSDAQTILQRLVNEDPSDEEALVSLAQLRTVLGDTEGGIGLLRKRVDESPTPLVVETLMELLRLTQRGDEAMGLTERLAREKGGDVWVVLHARELARAERRKDAEALLKEAVEKDPNSQALTAMLARLKAEDEREEEAIALVEAFNARRGANIERLYLLAHLYQEAGDNAKATAHLRRVLAIMPDHSGASNDLGYFWADRGVHLEEAEKLITRALEHQPNNGAFLDSLGWVYYKQGRFEKAVELLERAMAQATTRDVPEVASHYGDALYRVGRKAEAEAAWKRAYVAVQTSPGAMTEGEKKLKEYLEKVLEQVRKGEAPEITPLGKEEQKPPPGAGA